MLWKRKLRILWLLVILGSLHLSILGVLQTYTPNLLKDLYFDEHPDYYKQPGTIDVTILRDNIYKLYNVANISVNMTVVTAFFDIGDFVKGSRLMTRKLYAEWSGAYAHMINPMVVYTDSRKFYSFVKNLRANVTRLTKVFLVKRRDLWSFSITNKISKIYRQKHYPKFYPNTINPAYSSAQHAKYELVASTVRQNLFQTEFYCWMDFAYFREISKEKYKFVVVAPPNLNKSRVAFTEVFAADMEQDFEEIFLTNKIWIGGGMFVGKKDLLLQLEKDYKSAVHFFLDEDLMNTDQQVLYALYSDQGREALKPATRLQVYPADKNWFRLGYLCYRRIRQSTLLKLQAEKERLKVKPTKRYILTTRNVKTISNKTA